MRARLHTAALTDRIADAIRASQTRFRHLNIDRDMTLAAKRYALGLANGEADVEMWRKALGDLKDLDRRYSMWNRTTIQLVDTDHLRGKELVAGKEVDAIGIGVVQSPRASPRAGTVWVVVIFAQQ